MAKSYNYRSPWLLVLLLLIGAVIGSLADSLLASSVPYLKNVYSLGLRPSTLDFHFFSLTFGFYLSIGPLTAVGLILGYILYRRG